LSFAFPALEFSQKKNKNLSFTR